MTRSRQGLSRVLKLGTLCGCALFLEAATFAANPSIGPNNTPVVDPEKKGAEIAGRLRSAVPSTDAGCELARTGKLEVTTRDDKTTVIPFQSLVTTTRTNWTMSYVGFPGAKSSETLSIIHAPGLSNRYTLTVSGEGASGPRNLGAGDLVRPFAGSDFWACDLGLDFLHWPNQRVPRHEFRSSVSCWVLESSTPNPAPGGYARVVSWVTVEYGEALIHAEAYDKAGKRMKEFSIGSLEKVNGQRELKNMKIRNVRTGQETELKFELPKKQD